MRLSSFLVFLVLHIFAFSPVFADTLQTIQDRGVILVGTESNYFPFEMTDKTGKIVGFDMDIAALIAKNMGVKLEVVNSTVDGLIPGLTTKKYDIFIRGITLTQTRNLKVNFTEPYFTSGQTILIRKDLVNKVKSFEDLNQPNFKIVSKVGTTGEFSVRKHMPRAQYTAFETEQEAVMDVIHGKADAFVFDEPYNIMALKLFAKNKLVHLAVPFTYEPLAFAVRLQDHDFLNWLNNFLRQIRNDGTYDRLYKKWFVEDTWLKELKQQ